MKLCKCAMDVLWQKSDCRSENRTLCPVCKGPLVRLGADAGTTYREGDREWTRTGRCRTCNALARLRVRTLDDPHSGVAYEHTETLSIEVTKPH